MTFKKGNIPWNKNKKGLQTAWNKGLTKEDLRVMKYVKKMIGRKHSKESIGKNRKSHIGKKQSEETKIKRKIYEGRSQKEKTKDKIRIKVLERIRNNTFFYPSKNIESREKKSDSMKKIRMEHPERFTILSGVNHPNWIDGRSLKKYYPPSFRKIRTKILERDNFKCKSVFCDGSCEIIGVHHIDYNKENNIEKNLITLCNKCNILSNKNRLFMEGMFKQQIFLNKLNKELEIFDYFLNKKK